MKKCKNCGAIQSDDQTVCLDCSVPLGNSMTDAEENAADAVFEKKLNNMAEQTDDFYVPRHDKIMGYACILLIVASIVLMTLAHQAQRTISETLVSEITINDHTVALPDGVAFSVPSQRETQLNEANGLGIDMHPCLRFCMSHAFDSAHYVVSGYFGIPYFPRMGYTAVLLCKGVEKDRHIYYIRNRFDRAFVRMATIFYVKIFSKHLTLTQRQVV